jgi:hypothetical protein
MAVGDQTVAFANRGVITITGSGATPALSAFAAIKDVELTVSADHVPLYGWGSIFRVAVAKHQQKVSIKVGSMKFNPAVTGSSIAFWSFITNPTSGGQTNEDTNVVKTFTIDAYFTFEDGQILHGTVYDVYFPNLPFRANEGQWVKLDVSGEGASVMWAAA